MSTAALKYRDPQPDEETQIYDKSKIIRRQRPWNN